MRGVCIDPMNPAGRPTVTQLKALTPNPSVRLVYQPHLQWYNYYLSLQKHNVPVCLTLASESFSSTAYNYETSVIARTLRDYPPALWVIGNEPDGVGDSSWSMEWREYVNLFYQCEPAIRSTFPDAQVYTAGLVSGQVDWLNGDQLIPSMNFDGVCVHYPPDVNTLQAYANYYNKPVAVTEWTWRGGTRQEIIDWQRMLNVVSLHSFWFCWSDGMVPTHGLHTIGGTKLPEYHYYKEALSS